MDDTLLHDKLIKNELQGTVSPTHYIVVHDGSNLKVDHMQRLAYKMTHLYYNWPGTVRIPAPCLVFMWFCILLFDVALCQGTTYAGQLNFPLLLWVLNCPNY